MNKKPRIDSKLSVSNLKKVDFIELHVLVANTHAWRPDNWQSYERGSSMSIGFVKADVATSLFELRSTLLQQVRPESLPDQYVYLRQVGRASTICSARQERSLKAKDFAPPLYPYAEICILSAENMAFHPRMNHNGLLPPVTPAPNRLGTNNTAPITSLERSKSPSFRSLQSLDGSSYSMFNNNELMMAEIAFLDAKRALAEAHAQALRNQYLHNQSVMIENGLGGGDTTPFLGSEGESDEEEEAETRRKAEEQRKREEEEQERERIRKEEEEQRNRLLEMEEEKRRIRQEREERERQIEEEILAEENKARALYDFKRKAAEKKRTEEENRIAELERMAKEEEEERRRREEEITRKRQENTRRWIEDMLLEGLDKAHDKTASATPQDVVDCEVDNKSVVDCEVDHESLHDINNKLLDKVDQEICQVDEIDRLDSIVGETADLAIAVNQVFSEVNSPISNEINQSADDQEVESARLAEEMFKREEQRLKDVGESEDEEMDEAMKLIDDLTQTPRPWHAMKDQQQRKKIVRVAKEYTKEELEEVAYLRAKIGTYRNHRTTMESKHHDLLQRLSEMEKNWDEDEMKEFESKWRPKCKAEEVKTPQLYERNRQLRLELQMLYKQADTIISHAQAMKQSDDRKGMAFPSLKNNLRINLQRLQNEVTELRKRAATAQIKYEAEKSNREGVEKEVKQLRQELINSKISMTSVGAR